MKRKLFSTRYLLFFLVAALGVASIFTACSLCDPTEDNSIITYTVSFKTNSSTALNAKKIEKGKTITKPDAPNKSGYTFKGWYTTTSFTGALYNFGAAVTKNLTLYAKFVKLFTVTFNPLGGSAINPQEVTSEGKIKKPQDPTRAGYTFEDWYTTASFTGAPYDFNRVVPKNLTLYAKFVAAASQATAPGVPTDVKVFGTPTSNAITVQWTAVTAFGKAKDGITPNTAIGGYDVQYKESSLTDWLRLPTTLSSVAGDITQFTTPSSLSLTPGTTYDFRVRSVNADDNTKKSLFSTAVTISTAIDLLGLKALIDACKADATKCVKLESVNTSEITDMSNLFEDFTAFNTNISSWDTSSVTNMSGMFKNTKNFNQPLNDWDTDSVTNMENMFNSAPNFNQGLNDWNVSKVTNMQSMFYYASKFNQPLNKWKTGEVTNMAAMFYGTTDFNKALNDWDVRKVANMNSMFSRTSNFNQPLDNWKTGGVTDMSLMFSYAESFNQPLDKWKTGRVTNMFYMFANAARFNQNISGWDVDNVAKHNRFNENSVLTTDYLPTAWQPATNKATAPGVPTDVKVFGTPSSNAITVQWTAVTGFGKKKDGITPNTAIGGYDVQYKENSLTDWLRLPTTLSSVAGDITQFTTPSSLSLTPGTAYDFRVRSVNDDDNTKKSLFSEAETISTAIDLLGLKALAAACNRGEAAKCTELSNANTSEITDMNSLFKKMSNFNTDIRNWDTSQVITMEAMFSGASSFNQPLNDWDTIQVKNMSWMFRGASSFNQPLDNWKTDSVTNMESMFNSAEKFNKALNGWNVSKVTNMQSMFYYALEFNQFLNIWKTGEVTNMAAMFYGTTDFNKALNDWDVRKVANMNSMFSRTTNFNQPLDKWKTGKVTNMSLMFSHAESFNQPLDKWKTGKVTNMSLMFSHAESFNQNISGWDVDNVAKDNHRRFSADSPLTTANLPTAWQPATSQSTAPGVPTDVKVSGTPTKTQITITWTALLPANFGKDKDGDDNPTIGGYEVQYKETGTDWAAATTITSPVDGGATEFTASGLTPGTEYEFHVKSVNADDDTKKSLFSTPVVTISTVAAAVNTNPRISLDDLKILIAACKNTSTECVKLESVNTSEIRDMNSLFKEFRTFNTDIRKWDTSKVTNMESMFAFSKFNQPLNDWDTSKVTNMSGMFEAASSFNQALNRWDTSSVSNMNKMFSSASKFNQPLDKWKTGKVISMQAMFLFSTEFNQNLSKWKVGSVKSHTSFSTGSGLKIAAKLPNFKK